MIRWAECADSPDLLCGWEGGRPWGFGKADFLTVWTMLCPGPHRASSASRAAPPLLAAKLVLPCLETSNNFTWDSYAARVTLLMSCPSCLSFLNLALQLVLACSRQTSMKYDWRGEGWQKEICRTLTIYQRDSWASGLKALDQGDMILRDTCSPSCWAC